VHTTLVVYVNSDDALLMWSVDEVPDDCGGFAIRRRLTRDGKQKTTWLDNYAPPGTEKHQRGEHQPSNEWPFRAFTWTDHSVGPGDKVRYRVVPVRAHGPSEADASEWSADRTIGAPSKTPYSAYFNRGFVISQFLSRYLDDKFPGLKREQQLAKFKQKITEDDEDKIRQFLSGQLREQMLHLLAGVAPDEEVYAALFELADKELVPPLAALGSRAHVVLANGSIQVKKDAQGHATETTAEARKRDENDAARQVLHAAGVKVELKDRFVAPKPLAHNKFLVVVNAAGEAQRVWTGSTNWTPTGLCTQLNNGLLVEDPQVAKAYLKQWHALSEAKSIHPPKLPASNAEPTEIGDGPPGSIRTSVHFTRAPSVQKPKRGVDLEALADIVRSAKQGVLFLMFIPGGTGTFADVQTLSQGHPDLLVRGVVSELPNGRQDEQTGTSTTVDTTLFGTPEGTVKVTFEAVQPEGMKHPAASWAVETTHKQFLNQIGHAIIHSKVLVVDPFSDDPTVVTGSHNFSISASQSNDENFLVIRGDRDLAEAYAVNVESAWRHYAGRALKPHADLKGVDYLRALLADQRPHEHFWRLA
jgi:phosphatidylserine/phosphatidylglycerophosphate/cardiolipin synthase-like enzyme